MPTLVDDADRIRGNRLRVLVLSLLAMAAPPGVAHAHVKWFSEFSFADPPRALAEILTRSSSPWPC